MEAKFGNPLVLYKTPRYGPRGQTLARANAARLFTSFAKNRAASTIQRAFGKWNARKTQRGRTASTTTVMSRPTKKGFVSQEGNNSLTRVNYGTGMCVIPKSVLLNLSPEMYVSNFGYNAQTTTGLQGYTEVAYMEPGTLTTLSGFQIYKDLFIESLKAEVNMVNASESSNSLVIYDVIARGDLSSAGKNSSPGAAWSYGVDSEGGSATDYKIIGSVPTDSVMFNKFFKIVQRTRVNLPPGGMHRHEVTYRPNRKVQGFWPDAAPYGLGGLTCYTLIVHYGQPAHDSTTTTSVTMDISSLDIVTKTNILYKFLENSTINWQKNNTLATTFAVGEQFIDEAVGQTVDAAGLHPGTLHT